MSNTENKQNLNKVQVWGFEYDVAFSSYYGNNNTALLLTRIDEEGYLSEIPATVNLMQLHEEIVAIKNYSENSGVLDALIEAGYIYPASRKVPSGFVMIDICELTPEAIELMQASKEE